MKNLIDRLLENVGTGQLRKGALTQPSDLMTAVRKIHERTFYKLTGKRPLPSSIDIRTSTVPDSETFNNLSPLRRLVRRGL
ncbi:MAG: hypothetical protein K9W43_01710 [Candidatus Thorarchaeota archaeon]|nr:hypothetical protein [Candidatus Thorarchaeota archaeon]